MYNLFIVDDHPLMREGLAMILESQPDFNIVAMAGSAEEAMENIEKHRVDLLIVDISLPGMSGLELVKHMSALKPTLKMLVMSRHDEQLYAERVIRSGAKGYVMKVEARKVIIEAIRKILGGGIYISDAINERLIQSMMPGRRPIGQSPLEILSDRELEIFEMSESRGRRSAVRGVYRPNHLFKDGSYYSGQIDMPEGSEVKPGETGRVIAKMWDSGDLLGRLEQGVEWEIAEGGWVVGRAKLIDTLPN